MLFKTFTLKQNQNTYNHLENTIRASPHNVPTAMATKNLKICSYANDFANGTMATPIKPHIDIMTIEMVA